MSVNLLILSDNVRDVTAVSMADYTSTEFTSNVTQVLPYENMVLNLATSTSGLSFNTAMATISHGYGKIGFLIGIGVLLFIAYLSVTWLKRTYG